MALVQSIVLIILTLIADEAGSKLPPFELPDGARVCFIGDTFVERDQVFGYLETMLTARWPDRDIRFRNLGWSGDTVWGEARARFGNAADGFQHLKEHVEAIQPTVLFVAYGANESFAGQAGEERFEAGFNTLLNMLQTAAAPQAAIVLLLPMLQENLGPPLPDPAQHNHNVHRYRQIIQRIAKQRRVRAISVFDWKGPGSGTGRTTNGIHLTPRGYWLAAQDIMQQLGIDRSAAKLEIHRDGKVLHAQGVQLAAFEKLSNGFRFQVALDQLPAPPGPPGPNVLRKQHGAEPLNQTYIELVDVPAGEYVLRVDGEPAGTLRLGKRASIPLTSQRTEQLRQAIIEKNRLYFHRWRPQNETYLFGFRKHEQGQNAAEVPKFDALVDEQEQVIAKLRVPAVHTYELVQPSH